MPGSVGVVVSFLTTGGGLTGGVVSFLVTGGVTTVSFLAGGVTISGVVVWLVVVVLASVGVAVTLVEPEVSVAGSTGVSSAKDKPAPNFLKRLNTLLFDYLV